MPRLFHPPLSLSSKGSSVLLHFLHTALSPYLFNLYVAHIMKNAELDEVQAGIKIGRRNINNLRYVDDSTPMAESEMELKSLMMRVKGESERAGLKLNLQKT